MIDEQHFIEKLKQYDNSGLEFAGIDELNEVVKDTMSPIRKRGLNDNEFTVVNLAGFEIINNDTVLNLFNAIPPGPKELIRHRKHLVVGRYSTAIMAIVLLRIDSKYNLLVQTRQPLNLGGGVVTEIFRDYISPFNGTVDFTEYFALNFEKVIKNCSEPEIVSVGSFWESTGVMGKNISVYICDMTLKQGVTLKNVEDVLNGSSLSEAKNIIGERKLNFIPLTEAVKKDLLIDLHSQTGLFCLLRYLEKKGYTL